MASESGTAQTRGFAPGVVGPDSGILKVSLSVLENHSIEGERPVDENSKEPRITLSNTEHVELRMNLRRPWRKAKY